MIRVTSILPGRGSHQDAPAVDVENDKSSYLGSDCRHGGLKNQSKFWHLQEQTGLFQTVRTAGAGTSGSPPRSAGRF